LCENFANGRILRTLLIFSLLVNANPYPNAAAFFFSSVNFLQGFEFVHFEVCLESWGHGVLIDSGGWATV
jgi:hypothetical protein